MSIKSIAAKVFANYIYNKTQRWANNPIATQQKIFEELIQKAQTTLFIKAIFKELGFTLSQSETEEDDSIDDDNNDQEFSMRDIMKKNNITPKSLIFGPLVNTTGKINLQQRSNGEGRLGLSDIHNEENPEKQIEIFKTAAWPEACK